MIRTIHVASHCTTKCDKLPLTKPSEIARGYGRFGVLCGRRSKTTGTGVFSDVESAYYKQPTYACPRNSPIDTSFHSASLVQTALEYDTWIRRKGRFARSDLPQKIVNPISGQYQSNFAVSRKRHPSLCYGLRRLPRKRLSPPSSDERLLNAL